MHQIPLQDYFFSRNLLLNVVYLHTQNKGLQIKETAVSYMMLVDNT